jgi:4-alpha-glucanotransferase
VGLSGAAFGPASGSGVLLHPTCLPGPGVGDLGEAAHRFVDWLAAAGQAYWQILPLGPVDTGGSPYNGLSALAGNPLLISPSLLLADGLVEPGDLPAGDALPADRVDYPGVTAWKTDLLRAAHRRFRSAPPPELRDAFERFRADNEAWLLDYTLFRALRDHCQGAAWTTWPLEVRRREPEALERFRGLLADEIERFAFQQFLFDRQWGALRAYGARKGIAIIGDLPIFVAHNSADVWAHPEIFDLDERGTPGTVAGVPPDYFSATGQRWGNPLYRWEVLRRRGYDWWVERFRRTLDLVDVVRLDHFRGFESYWAIPASEETAVSGRWRAGPGADFFRQVQRRLGSLPVIAEDLGLITDAVDALREELGFPGMRVLQFAFDGDPNNPHLPENHPVDSIAYTGTHDNDTLLGWWAATSREERRRVRRWLGVRRPDEWDFIAAVFRSAARLAIVPLQDVLGLGSEARMNTPGSSSRNWTWRLERLPAEGAAERLGRLTRETGRAASSW